jgi:hypothetical protein
MTEEQILGDKSGNFRFMSFFESVQIEFPGNEYQSVNWIKAKSEPGSNVDCIQVSRKYSADKDKDKSNPIAVRVVLHLDHQPKKYKLSPQLQRVLGI